MAAITGGEPQKKTLRVSEEDAKQIDSLIKAGVGQGGGHTLTPQGANAIMKLQTARLRVRNGGMTPGERYEAWRESYDHNMKSHDPRVVSMRERAFEGFRQKAISPGAVHNDSTIASMSVQYANDAYIGEQLMPVVSVAKQSDKYAIYPKRDRLAYPDDALNADGDPNEINESRQFASYLTQGYGFTNRVPVETVANQDAPLDEMMDLTEAIIEGMAFKRENRIAAILTAAANYATGNTQAISAGNRWDTSNGGTVIQDMQRIDASLWQGRGPSRKVAFSSLNVFHVLSRNAAILELFKYNGSSPGLATPAMIMRFFEFDEYLIGRSRKDTANEGAADGNFERIWSDVFGVVRVANRPTTRSAHFGSTFRWSFAGAPFAAQARDGFLTQQWYDNRKGIAGTWHAKASVSEDHKVVANDTGFLYTTPVG